MAASIPALTQVSIFFFFRICQEFWDRDIFCYLLIFLLAVRAYFFRPCSNYKLRYLSATVPYRKDFRLKLNGSFQWLKHEVLKQSNRPFFYAFTQPVFSPDLGLPLFKKYALGSFESRTKLSATCLQGPFILPATKFQNVNHCMPSLSISRNSSLE